MKYCVIKDTTKVIDGSENTQEMMLQNAQNAGFEEAEIELLTGEEFEARKALELIPIAEPTENEMIMLAIAELDAQRELDKTETELAIAELAETLLGGAV